LPVEFENHYVIKPAISFARPVDYTIDVTGKKGILVKQGFEYNSGTNLDFLTVEQLREMNEQL